MHLRIQVPAFNEEQTIEQVVSGAIHAAECAWPDWTISLAVFNDGSTDNTAGVVQDMCCHDPRITLICHSTNVGLGRIFRDGLASATNANVDILVHIDSDGQFDPADIPSLVSPVVDGGCDLVTASRFVDPSYRPEMKWGKAWGNAALSRAISCIAGQRFFDVTCGFRAYSARAVELLRRVLSGNYTYTYQSILSCCRAGLRVTELPLVVRGEREFGRSRISSSFLRYGFHASYFLARSCFPLRVSYAMRDD